MATVCLDWASHVYARYSYSVLVWVCPYMIGNYIVCICNCMFIIIVFYPWGVLFILYYYKSLTKLPTIFSEHLYIEHSTLQNIQTHAKLPLFLTIRYKKGESNMYRIPEGTLEEYDLCLNEDNMVISVNGGHGSLNKNRACPRCSNPTILCDSGWEYCSVCNWKER